MTPDEVTSFLDEHMKRYPALRKWLAANDGQLEIWEEQLSSVDLDDAISASRELYEADEQPRGYGMHPREIRRRAYAIGAIRRPTYQSRHIGGEEVFNCSRCLDSGLVSVLTPATLKALFLRVEHGNPRYCSIACACAAGDKYATPPKDVRALPRWSDRATLITYDAINRERWPDDPEFSRPPVMSEWEAAKQLFDKCLERRQTPVSLEDWASQ